MNKIFLILLVSFNTRVVQNRQIDKTNSSIKIFLNPNQVKIVDVPGNSEVQFLLQNITSAASFILCQIHTQTRNLTLTLNKIPTVSTAVTGRDVGVVTTLKEGQEEAVWYIFNHWNDSVKALVHVTVLSSSDPLPGGCNEEWNLENDPNLQLDVKDIWSQIRFQWANAGYGRNTSSPPATCDTPMRGSEQSNLKYDLYVSYIRGNAFSEDAFMDGVKKMIEFDSVKNSGSWVKSFENAKVFRTLLNVSSYPRRGAIYNLVVSDVQKQTWAAYVPYVDYGCDIQNVDSSCKAVDIPAVIFATLGGIVGVFLCFLGHRYFKTEVFIFGFLSFALIFYQVFAITTSVSEAAGLSLAGVCGLVGGLLWFGLWWYMGVPVLTVLLIGLCSGYIFSSIIFYTPIANLPFWDTPFNYGICFFCGILILPVFMLCYTRVLNIFSCAFIGSYGVVLAIDVYINGGMKLIVVNSLRHAVHTKEYLKILIVGPYTVNDIILTVLWFVILVAGMAFQFYRERGKAPFPPAPRMVRAMARSERGHVRSRPVLRQRIRGLFGNRNNSSDTEEEDENTGTSHRGRTSERAPLLRNEGRPQYGTSTRAPLLRNDGSPSRYGINATTGISRQPPDSAGNRPDVV